MHDQMVFDYLGWHRTISLLVYKYYLQKMNNTVYWYGWNCHTSKRAHVPRVWSNCLLKSLSLLTNPWTDVSLDFVMRLLFCKSYNAILIVINQLTKKRHYIPCTTDKNNTIDEATLIYYEIISKNSKGSF